MCVILCPFICLARLLIPEKDMIRSARAPLDYDLVFYNETGSTNDTENYLGYRTLQSYNVTQCAEECDSKPSCTSFNIFFERDPSLNPDKDAGCANPASLTNIKCSWWTSAISASVANNTGETRIGFQIAVTGSNGKDSLRSLFSLIRFFVLFSSCLHSFQVT